jgi:hypothetical protein
VPAADVPPVRDEGLEFRAVLNRRRTARFPDREARAGLLPCQCPKLGLPRAQALIRRGTGKIPPAPGNRFPAKLTWAPNRGQEPYGLGFLFYREGGRGAGVASDGKSGDGSDSA